MTENQNLFLEAIRQEGMTPPDNIEPGKIFRFAGAGKANGNRAGWGKLFADGLGGVYGDYSSNLSKTWQAEKSNTSTPEERAAFKKQVEESRKQAEQERKKYQAERAMVARQIYEKASGDPTQHPYAIKKHLPLGDLVHHGEWSQRGWSDALLFPIYSPVGTITSIQAINTDGTKDFLAGGQIGVCFYPIGKIRDTTGTIYIAEGVATLAAVCHVTGCPGVAAMSAGNLEAVAKVIRSIAPDAEIIIIADDDQKEDGSNPGRDAARKAADAIGCSWAIPDLGKKADAWDVWHEQGADGIKAMLDAATAPSVTKTDKKYSIESCFGSSQSSSSSLSTTYPSLGLHQNEEVLHCFKNVLVQITEDEKPRLVPESVAAERISQALDGRYAYDVSGSCWLKYGGSRWLKCSQTELDTEVTTLLFVGAGQLGFRNAYQAGVAALLKKGGWNRLKESPPGKIPFLNGLLDLSSKTLEMITPDNAFTWVLPFEYEESAHCPNFFDWLLAAVDNDLETVQLLRAWINALLTGRPDLQVFLHIIGPAGTGKSTFGRLVFVLVGNENATTTSLKQLETNRFEAANFYGKRLVAIEEADKFGGSVSVLKSLTGQDFLRLERKNEQQSSSFVYGGQTIMMSNERLATTDYTSGIERRRITVEFKKRITAEEKAAWRDRGGEEVIIHQEAPGIINWALSLSRDEVTEIFKTMPERVQRENLEAARFNNPVLDWMMDNLIPDSGAQTKIGTRKKVRDVDGSDAFEKSDEFLYPNYLTWCGRSGRETLSLQRFGSTLVDAANTIGIDAKKLPRQSDGMKIMGLRLRKPSEQSLHEEVLHSSEDLVKDKCLIMKNMKTVKTINQVSIQEDDFGHGLDGQEDICLPAGKLLKACSSSSLSSLIEPKHEHHEHHELEIGSLPPGDIYADDAAEDIKVSI
ncbi:MAG: toprim domain-containing protein [Deltaproteobacteria bacterium]|nr:toprim domain-containing protein [Deltaproteobacteria bacterium]